MSSSTPYVQKLALRKAKPADSVVQRVLSAKEQRARQLENEVGALRRQLHQLSTENRLLHAQNKRHAAALGRFQDVEAELPTLLAGHADEVRALRQRCQRLAVESREQARELRTKTAALQLAREQVARLRGVLEDKGLVERQLLQKRLEEAEARVRELEQQLTEVSRRLELEQRSSRHHLAREQRRTREAQEELSKAELRIGQLESDVRRTQRTMPTAAVLFARRGRAEKPTSKPDSDSELHLSSSSDGSEDDEELARLYEPKQVASLQAQWAVDSRTFSLRQPSVPPPPPQQPPPQPSGILPELREEEAKPSGTGGSDDSDGDNYTKEALLKALEEIDRQNLVATKTESVFAASNGHALGVRD
ncbi:Hypothetical predicted protein [Cloeon dipterum]|uniref:Lebercilin domain-containing protein n=1 Tax=Cloeon dipterum TaxID=197152 RepID=A0A8S1DMB3_9INSE|nr:Hypothetical predicted protein [Cloeon dipterum]